MHINLAFFENDTLLAAGAIHCTSTEETAELKGQLGHRFLITHQFEEPACPIVIECFIGGENLYRSASRFGVHTSEDWESIVLGVHTLVFKCQA